MGVIEDYLLPLYSWAVSQFESLFNGISSGSGDLYTMFTSFISLFISLINNSVSLSTSFFKATIEFVIITTQYAFQIFQFIIFISPLVIQALFFLFTHWYLLLIMLECIILVRCIITRGFMQKFYMYYTLHLELLKGIMSIPLTFSKIFGEFQFYYRNIIISIEISFRTIAWFFSVLFESILAFNIGTVPVGAIVVGASIIITITIGGLGLLLALLNVN